MLKFILLGILVNGCKIEPVKSVPPEASDPAPSDDGAVRTIERNASAVNELRRSADFFFQVWNQRYEVNFKRMNDAKLQTGTVPSDKKPFSGYWYREANGGTNINGALTRYDQAFHGAQTLATTWEKDNHVRKETEKDAGWSGHCNGWAASAQRHAEPRKSVVRNGVTFSANDIKALLAEVYMNALPVFLGGTRCGIKDIPCTPSAPATRRDPTKLNAYEDVNPATFHVVLTNWIGRFKHTIIFDEKNDEQVWNYPIYAYSYSHRSLNSAADALALIASDDGRGYRFNPEATKFVLVDMTVTYANALQGEAPAQQFPNQVPALIKYQYVLELSTADEILGGEWTKQNQDNHPDFVWVALEPDDDFSGDKSGGNPHINADEVIKMWAESIDADLNNPPTDIKTPNYQTNWGIFPEFSVVLDGNKNGAVFSGAKTKLRIERIGRLAEKITLELGLNEQVIKTIELEKGDKAEIDFDSPVGLNRLAFIWKQTGTEPYNAYVRYYAVQ